ncbi:MAG: hypothetical protein JST16_15600 [Bdellovibrionales bacterium]|nr:hypothetical protein [Bdellovibrionales bacterium]
MPFKTLRSGAMSFLLIACGLGGFTEKTQATPQLLKIDGSIYSSTGTVVTGNKDIKIYAYSANTGGSSLWSSSVYNATLTNGRFSIVLDASTGSPSLMSRIAALGDTTSPWFEIEVDSGTAGNAVIDTSTIVKPRFRAKGAMFAISAANTDRLRGVTVSSATPTDGQVLAYNSSLVQWEPQNPAGKDATYPTEAARHTTAATAVYVRTDGSDTTCNGSVDASSASAPACSFATPQKAVDALPEVLLNAVTVNIAAGTYRTTTSGANALTIQKQIGSSGSLLVVGNGSVILSGATSGAPTTAVGYNGVDVYAPTTRGFTLKNITTQYFVGSGIRFNPHSAGVLDTVTSSNNSFAGVEGTSAYIEAIGTNTLGTGNSYGLYIAKSQFNLIGTGSVTANSNIVGMIIAFESQAYGLNGTSYTANSNTSGGVIITGNAFFYPDTLTANSSSGGSGVTSTNGSYLYCDANGSITASSNGVYGFNVAYNASIYTECPLTFSSNTAANWALTSSGHGTMLNNSVTMSGTNTAASISILDSSSLAMWGTAALSTARGSVGTGIGIYVDSNSQFSSTASGTISITQYQSYGIYVSNGSRFIDAGAGTRTVSNATTVAGISELSLYRKGGFAAGSCDASSRCN